MTRRRVLGCLLPMLILLRLSGPARAGEYYGTESPFVVGASARTSALGAASTALESDASVISYNPAGLTHMEWKEFVFYRTVLFDSKSVYQALSYAHPLLHMGVIGVGIMRLDVGGVEERDQNNELLSNELKNSQTRVLLGYAARLSRSLGAGFNLKVDHQNFAGSSGTGVGLDLGLTATQRLSGSSKIRSIHEGLVVQNALEPSVKLMEDGVADPMRIGVGAAVVSAFGNVFLVTAIDIERPRFSPFRIRFGQEVSFLGRYSIRGGFDHDTPTWGFGARFKGAAFDYAYRNQDLDQNHRISLSFRFGDSITEKRTASRAALERDVNSTIDSRMKEFERRQVARAIQEGDSLFAEERYDEALDRYGVALLWDPGNDHAAEYEERSAYSKAMTSGAQSFSGENFVEALLHFRKALDHAPEDSTALAMAALCTQRISASRKAEELVRSLLRQSIDLYDGQRYGDALSGFDEVLKIAPTNEFAREFRDRCEANIERLGREHRRRARLAVEESDYATAVRELESVLSYRPLDGELKSQIQALWEEQRRVERGEEEQVKARPGTVEKQTPSQPGVTDEEMKEIDHKYNQAMKSFKAGDFDGAITGFQDVWTVNPRFHAVSEFLTKAYLLKGMRLYSQEHYDDAATLWKRALNIDPDNDKVKRYLAKIGEELQKVPGGKGG